jgi:hypothetical protein
MPPSPQRTAGASWSPDVPDYSVEIPPPGLGAGRLELLKWAATRSGATNIQGVIDAAAPWQDVSRPDQAAAIVQTLNQQTATRQFWPPNSVVPDFQNPEWAAERKLHDARGDLALVHAAVAQVAADLRDRTTGRDITTPAPVDWTTAAMEGNS